MDVKKIGGENKPVIKNVKQIVKEVAMI